MFVPQFIMKKIICFVVVFLWLTSRAFSDEPVGRYISLAPSTTEILFALGLDEEIVGVSTYCTYPPQALQKAKMGEFSHPNIEKIVSLKPDYVFCTGLEQAQTIAELRRLGLPVFVEDPSTVEELVTSIIAIGTITHRDYRAQMLVKQIQDEIDAVQKQVLRIPPDKRQKVFIEIWNDPLTTAGKGSYIDELITLAGGDNIAYDTRRPYSVFSPEEVMSRDPDCIIMTYMDKSFPANTIGSRFAWDTLKAVKNNRIYNDINPDILLRPGPRVGEAIEELYKRLYPTA